MREKRENALFVNANTCYIIRLVAEKSDFVFVHFYAFVIFSLKSMKVEEFVGNHLKHENFCGELICAIHHTQSIPFPSKSLSCQHNTLKSIAFRCELTRNGWGFGTIQWKGFHRMRFVHYWMFILGTICAIFQEFTSFVAKSFHLLWNCSQVDS